MPKFLQTTAALKKRAAQVLEALVIKYPHPATHLNAEGPWQLLVAVVLSAQSTDNRVNMVTPELFTRWPDAASLAEADVEEVKKVIHSTGFYNNKAKNIIAAAQRVMQVYGGQVPQSMQELITLGGVARKTANVVLWNAFGINEGIAIDTHVGRIVYRLGLTKNTAPVAVERDLMKLFPQEEWGRVNYLMVWFGRDVCDAKKPLCAQCEMEEFCPQVPWISPHKK